MQLKGNENKLKGCFEWKTNFLILSSLFLANAMHRFMQIIDLIPTIGKQMTQFVPFNGSNCDLAPFQISFNFGLLYMYESTPHYSMIFLFYVGRKGVGR